LKLVGSQFLPSVYSHEPVHRAAAERLLFVGVLVVLIAGDLLSGTAQAHGLQGVGIAQQKLWAQAVHRWGARLGDEGLAVDVGGIRVGAEVVVE